MTSEIRALAPAKKIKPKNPASGLALSECVSLCLQEYYKDLGDQAPSNLYNFVLKEVEAPLLKSVLEYTSYNQSQTAEILGLNRGTLRKKLKQYDLL